MARDAFYESKAIYEDGSLRKSVVYGNRQSVIPKRYVCNVWFQPTKIFSSLPARYYYGIKKRYLDWVSSLVVRSGCDIFHGWSGEALLSLRQAKGRGAISFLEHPAPHILWSDKMMEEEYALCGIRRPAVTNFPFLRRFPIVPELLLAELDLADYIVVQSSFSHQTMVDAGIDPHRLVLVSQGVDAEKFRPGLKENSVFRAIFVGSLNLRKGVRYLLEAWAQLQLKGAEVVLIGAVHDEVRSILGAYSGMSGLKLQGYVKDPVHLYHQASVFILPSLAEGSAKVIYEAMACGLPVIVTPNAGAEIRDGIEGSIVPARDVRGLKERLLFFYENEKRRREMGEAARALAEQFTWERRGRLLLSAYRVGLKRSCRLG